MSLPRLNVSPVTLNTKSQPSPLFLYTSPPCLLKTCGRWWEWFCAVHVIKCGLVTYIKLLCVLFFSCHPLKRAGGFLCYSNKWQQFEIIQSWLDPSPPQTHFLFFQFFLERYKILSSSFVNCGGVFLHSQVLRFFYTEQGHVLGSSSSSPSIQRKALKSTTTNSLMRI